jgi:hypothetical protein
MCKEALRGSHILAAFVQNEFFLVNDIKILKRYKEQLNISLQ